MSVPKGGVKILFVFQFSPRWKKKIEKQRLWVNEERERERER